MGSRGNPCAGHSPEALSQLRWAGGEFLCLSMLPGTWVPHAHSVALHLCWRVVGVIACCLLPRHEYW